jgi:carbonic anhydrase
MADGQKQPASKPEEIRSEIEETREELGDTVEALAQKTDVKAQAKKKVAETQDTVEAGVERIRERPVVLAAVAVGGLFLLWRRVRR